MENKTIADYFVNVELKKHHNGYYYKVQDAIVIVILGLICGLKNMSEIYHWATQENVSNFLNKKFMIEKIPCYYWLLCLIKLIKPLSIERCFREWVTSILPSDRDDLTIAFDGKTVRSTVKQGCQKSPLHIISAQLSSFGITLAQKSVDTKKNEIPTVQELLEELEISGCMIVADALNCQKKTAKIIVDKKADYLLDVKGNHKGLKEDIKDYVDDNKLRKSMDTAATKELNRGRIEKRKAFCTTNIEWLQDRDKWAGISCIGAIHKTTEENGKYSEEWHYYISSRSLTAKELLKYARQEWAVESMHWLLDVHFSEDSCRILDDATQKILNILRKVAINIIKTFKNRTNSKLPINKIMLSCLVDSKSILNLIEN